MLKVLAWDDPYLSDREFLCLTRGRELITPPENWTQGVEARDAIGNEVHPNDDNAEMFCAVGAIAHYAPGIDRYRFDELRVMCKFRLDAEVKAAHLFSNGGNGQRFYGIEVYNDKGDDLCDIARVDLHQSILRMFDLAIAHRRHEIDEQKIFVEEPALVS